MLDYGRVMALRAPVLESLHRTFVARERDGATRARARVRAFVEREDPQLTQFATFMAIAEREGPDARHGPSRCATRTAPRWRRCATELAERVDFHRWLQFELDRQLGCVAADAARAGLALGVYQDLAVGSAPSGSDVWAQSRVCSSTARRSARRRTCTPTKDRTGDCRRSTRTSCARRATTTGCGCCAPASGTRARCASITRSACSGCSGCRSARRRAKARSCGRSANDLFGILALESVRHGALVVGEDLGTVPPRGAAGAREVGRARLQGAGVRARLPHRPLPAAHASIRGMALATVNTHDLPPLVGLGWSSATSCCAARSAISPIPSSSAAMRDGAHERPLGADRDR